MMKAPQLHICRASRAPYICRASRAPFFHCLLIVTLLIPQSAHADDMASSTMGGVSSALGNVNGFFSAYGSSGLQLQSLATQLSVMQQNTAGVQTQQSQFNQIQQQLQLAMVEAQACVQKAVRPYDKYYAKRKDKQLEAVKNLTPDQITSLEPTCSTAAVIMDAIALNKAKMEDTNKKMSCIMNLQNSVNQIAERAKAPFQQLINAAGEVQKTYTQIIDAHKKIAEKISLDVDGKDGKGGYRESLNNLKKMKLDLNNVLNAKQGESKDGLKTGLVKQVENLKQMRVSSANSWYFDLMQDVEYCYQSQPAPCFDNDVDLPPAQCIGASIANQGQGNDVGNRVRAKTDMAGLNNISLSNYMNAQKVNLPANLDVSQPDAFLAFTRSRFDETLSGVLSTYRQHSFKSRVDNNAIANFVNHAYNACYDKATANFRSDMSSQGSRYYGKLNAIKDAERETSNDIKNWIDRVEGEMSDFRTQFHKVYNSELGQFKSDCTADEDPYKSLDCLRVLSATLESGIRGTRQATKLSNGSTFAVNAGETALQMQTLTLDANGKPTIGNSTATCSGFDDCINYMDRSRMDHENAQQQTEQDRQKFVDQNNTTVKQAFAVVANQFSQMSQLIAAGVKGVNDDLVKIGVKSSIKTTNAESETLEVDDKTGLIKMPKSMKSALAGLNGYTEVDDVKDVTSAFNSMASELNRKSAEAAKMKNKCKVSKSDYEGLANVMPSDCSDTNAICGGRNRVLGAMGSLETLFRKSKDILDDNTRNTSSNEYRSCKNEIMSDAKQVTRADLKRASNVNGLPLDTLDSSGRKVPVTENVDQARDDAQAEKQNEAKKRVAEDCNDVIFEGLETQAGQGRKPLDDQNKAIVQKLRDVSDACVNADLKPGDDNKIGSDSNVTAMCDAFKSSVRSASPPTSEDPSEVVSDGHGLSSPSTNVLTMPGVPTTVPAN